MRVYIDKSHGTHYHKEGCPMTADTRYHYEPVEVDDDTVAKHRNILIGKKSYYPCACMFTSRTGTRV